MASACRSPATAGHPRRTSHRCALIAPLLLVTTFLLDWHASEALRAVRSVHCDVFVQLRHQDLDLLNLTEPLLLKHCNATDAHFRHIFAVLGKKSALQARYGSFPMNVFPTGPFHLQLGSTLAVLNPIGTTTLRSALDRLAGRAFAFGTTRDNPGYTIVEDTARAVANLQRHDPPAANATRIFNDYFRHFGAHIFSMGGRDSGAGFHYHQSAWLFLCAGRKEWILAPYEHVLPQDLVWTSLAKLKSEHDLEQLFPGDEVIHLVQQPGDVVVLPSFWHHATLNLDEYTVGLGGQQHPKLNDRDPQHMVDYRTAFTAGDWGTAAAVQEQAMSLHSADVGAALRFILMSLRQLDVDAARAVYYRLRDKVFKAFQEGTLMENDVTFLLVEQLGVCVQDGLARCAQRDEAANGGTLPDRPTDGFLRLLDFSEETQSIKLPTVEPRAWTDRIQGAVDKLLGPLCFDVPNFAVVHTDANCTTYARNRDLCTQRAECDVHAPHGPKHCDVLSGLKHTEACCACGGGRDFRSPEQIARANALRPMSVEGGQGAAIYMQLRTKRKG